MFLWHQHITVSTVSNQLIPAIDLNCGRILNSFIQDVPL